MTFEVGNVYTFNTKSPAFLGTEIKNAKCLIAGMNAQMARRFAAIDQQYRTIFPTLPPGSVDDITAQTFYLFQGENGSEIVLAEQWIDMNSINAVDFVTASVYLPQITPQNIEKVRVALLAAGITSFEITVNQVQ